MSFISMELSKTAAGVLSLLPRLGALLPRLPEITITFPALSNQNSGECTVEQTEIAQQLENQSFLNPASLQGLWNGILNAAPKKKVSHQKKRQRQLAPGKKQLQFLNNLNRCPSCGHYKRAHTLCMHCVGEIKKHWKEVDLQASKNVEETAVDDEVIKVGDQEESIDLVDKRVLYPGKKKVVSSLKHVEKEEYLERRPKTLPVEK